jgi:hypothetical protein
MAGAASKHGGGPGSRTYRNDPAVLEYQRGALTEIGRMSAGKRGTAHSGYYLRINSVISGCCVFSLPEFVAMCTK